MSGRRGVKTKKSAIPGVTITQFVEDVPKGCSTPDFERKPITLTLAEGKNAIFRAVVKGEPKPEILWKRSSGKMDDPQKYQIASIPGTNEFTLQINKITSDDADVYRFTAVNDYGEATCSAGLKIIQVGFKKKAKEAPTAPQTDLKKEIEDFKKILKKRTPTAARKKEIDMEQVWQLLLNADKKDYEKICLKYGIVDFRGMLRKLQDMRKEREDKQAQYVYNVANLKHVRVNQEHACASFNVEMELKSPESRIYLYKDGEMINFGFDSDNIKHCLRQVGKKYNFTINDLQPEDAGVYQIKVEDVAIFSTELEAENIPVYFRYPLGEARCHEQGNAVFQCTLFEPCFNALWFHKQNQLKPDDKHEISVSNDGLTHRLVIKNAQPSDKGTYTIDIGRRTSSAWLEVESKGKRKQTGGDSKDKAGWQSKVLDEDRAKKLRQGEGHEDQDHLADSGMGKYGQNEKDHDGSAESYSSFRKDGSLGKDGRMGQFSAVGDGDYSTQVGLFGKDGMPGGAGTGGFSDVGGAAGFYGKEGMLGGVGGPGSAGSIGGLYGKDGMPIVAGAGGPGDADGIAGLYGKDTMPTGAVISGPGGAGGIGGLYGKDGMPLGAGAGGPYAKDGVPLGVGASGPGDAGSVSGLYGKDGMPLGAGAGGPGGAGGIGGLYGKGGIPLGAGADGPGSAGGVGGLYGKDGVPLGAGAGGPGDAEGVGGLYGKDGVPLGAGAGGPGGAGGFGGLYGKGGIPLGAGADGPGSAGGVGGLYGKDGVPLGAGAGGPGDAEGVGGLYGKDGVPLGAGAGGPGGAGGFGGLYGKDGMPLGAGTSGPGGAGGVGGLYGKDGMPLGAGAGGPGGAGGVGGLYGKDGMPLGVGAGGPGGAGSVSGLYGKDGMLLGAGVGGHGGAGGIGVLYDKDGMSFGEGAGEPGGAGGIGRLYGKDGMPLGAGAGGSGGAGGIGVICGKDGMPLGAGASGHGGAGGIVGLYGKDGMPLGAGAGGHGGAGGIGGLYGKDGMPVGAGAGGPGSAGGVGGLYGKDGMPLGAGAGGHGGAGGIGGLYGKDGMPVGAGAGGPGSAGGVGGLYGKDGMPLGAGAGGHGGAGGIGGLYGKDGMPLGAGIGGAGGIGGLYGKDDILGAAGTSGAGDAGDISGLYGMNGMPGKAGTCGPGSAGGAGGVYGRDNILVVGAGAGGGAGKDGITGGAATGEHGGIGVAGLLGKDGVGSGPGGIGTSAGGPGVVGGAGGLYAKDGMLGGVGGVAGFYDKDGTPVGIGMEGPGGFGGKGGLYGKDGMLAGAGEAGGFYGKDGMPSGAGTGGAGGLHGKEGILAGTGGAGRLGGLYGKDGMLDGTGALENAGGLAGQYGKDGTLVGAWGAGGTAGLYGKDGMPSGAGTDGAGGAGGISGLYGKDGLLVGAGGPDAAGRIDGLHGKEDVLGGVGVEGAAQGTGRLHGKDGILGEGGGSGGIGGLYGKDGMLAGAGSGGPGGAGGIGGLYGKDGMPPGAGAGGPGGAGGIGGLYGKDGMPLGAGANGSGGDGGVGGLYGKDGMPLGAGASGPGGAGGVGGLYGKDGMPLGAGAGGPGGAGGVGGLYGKDGMPLEAGESGPGGAGGVSGLYGKDGMPLGAGTDGPGDAGGAGGPHGKSGLLSGAGGASGLQGKGGVLDGTGPGGAGGLYGKDGMPFGTRAGGTGGLYDKDGMTDGSGTGGAGGLYGRHGMPAGAGTGGAGGVGSLYGKDGMLGATGTIGIGHNGGGPLGNFYGRDGRLGGAGTDGSLHGKMSGIPGDDILAHGQSSGLHDAGLYTGDRRRQLSDLDARRLTSADTSSSRDRKGRGGSLLEDDMREPHCRFTQGLFDIHAQKGRPAVLSCSLNNDQLEGIWFKDGFKITGLDGVSIKKEGPVHKLLIDEVQDNHAGKYKFEAEGVRTEASIFVEDPPTVDPALLEKLRKEPIVVKAGKNAMVKIPFEGRKPIRSIWLKDDGELLDDARISTDYSDNYTRLCISSTNRKDCGDYKVKLKNESGSTEATLKLVVIDKPQPPTGPIEVVDSSTSGITIQWKPPKDDGGKPIQSYIIERQQVGRKTWLTLGETSGNSTIFTTNKVEHDKSYYFRVRAVNAEGVSEVLESEEVMAATKVFPGPPAPPKIVSANRGAITLSWAAPHKTGNSRILGYTVEKSKKGSNSWIPVTDLPITERKYTVTDLKEGLQYEFRVAAINSAGTGEASTPSEAVFARDPMKPPGPVKDLKVVNTDYCSISLSWMKPESEEESHAKGYIVEMRHSDMLKWTQCNALPIPMTTYIVRGLKAREMYFLRVRAVNDGGFGEPVELDTCVQTIPPIVTPKVLVKDTVKSFMIVKAGTTIRVRIPFEASPSPEVYWLKDGHVLPAKATTATREGMSHLIIPGADFSDSGHYSIVLRSELGKKEIFSFLVQVLDVPESPGPIQLVEKVPETVTLIWEPSPTEKRDRNLNYMVMRRDSSKGSWHVVADLIYTNKCTVANFVPGREYFFRVLAKNYMGISEPSETVQPWSIHKERGKFEVRLPKYKGINQKQPPRFLVLLKPHVVTLGFDCHMSCAVTGYPAPQVTWYKDGRNISKDPTFFSKNDLGVCSLVIPGVAASDAGQYMVVAINELGEANSKAELTIKESIFY